MSLQEAIHQRNDLVRCVFQKVVSGLGQRVDFGFGKTPAPFMQIVCVEDEIVRSPADQHRQIAEPVKVFVQGMNQLVDRIGPVDGNIAHEHQGGKTVVPAVVRCGQAGAYLAGQSAAGSGGR